MRMPGEWMKAPDDRILEFIADRGMASPSIIAAEPHIHYSKGYIAKRCRALRDRGLLESPENVQPDSGIYDITDEGLAYLRENFDVTTMSYIEKPENADGPSASAENETANGGGA